MAQVFIVAGDPDLRKLLAMLLRRHYTLAEAPSAALAMEPLRVSSEPLVVLWDLYLPAAADRALLTGIEQEPTLARHAFVLLASNREGLPVDVRARLARLQLPTISMPFDLDDVLRQVRAATEQVVARVRLSGEDRSRA